MKNLKKAPHGCGNTGKREFSQKILVRIQKSRRDFWFEVCGNLMTGKIKCRPAVEHRRRRSEMSAANGRMSVSEVWKGGEEMNLAQFFYLPDYDCVYDFPLFFGGFPKVDSCGVDAFVSQEVCKKCDVAVFFEETFCEEVAE